MSDVQTTLISSSTWNESKKPPYQVDQQIKFLHLAAEVESLWQQLQKTSPKKNLKPLSYLGENLISGDV
ncbi:MAG: hypothetical protein V7K67_08845 [Nostoc sp.]|uniref:hypothetical protein n=1 Tax=Nostoc sp. TaxID=1180 RepID=UPI002FF147F0